MLPIHYHEFKVTPRAEELGGGWNLQLLQDGRPVGGSVFVPDECGDAEQTHAAAVKEGQAWLETRPGAAFWAAYTATLQQENMP
jgi:hypothetical protein